MLEALRRLKPPQLLLVLVAGLLPLVRSFLLLRSFRTPQLAILIVSFLVLIGLALGGSGRWIRREPPAVKVAIAAFGALLAWLTVSALAGMDPLQSLTGHPFQSTGLFFWAATIALFLAALRYRSRIAEALAGIQLGAGMILLGLVLVWLLARELIQGSLVPLSPEGVPLAAVGNSALLSAFCGVPLIFAAARAVERPSRWKRWLLLAVALGGFMTVAHPRGAVLTLPLVVAGGIFVALRRKVPRARVAIVWLLIIAAGVSSLVVIYPRLPQGSQKQLAPAELANAKTDVQQFGSFYVMRAVGFRAVFWKIAGRTISDHPLLGVGSSNFSYAFRTDVTRKELEAIPRPHEVQDLHNMFVELAATGGIPAAAFALVGVVAAAAAMLGGGRDERPRTWIGLGAAALLLLHMYEPLNLALTPLMAILAGASARGSPVPASAEASGWRARFGARAVLIGVPSFAGLVFAGMAIYSDLLFERGSLEWNRKDLERAVALDPTCRPCLYEMGKVRAWDFSRDRVGNLSWALDPYRRAVSMHPLDSEAHYRLAGGLLFLGEPKEAILELTEAKRLYPLSVDVTQGLAVAYLRAGRPAEAVGLINEVIDFAPTAFAYSILADAAENSGMIDLAVSARAEARRLDPTGLSEVSPTRLRPPP